MSIDIFPLQQNFHSTGAKDHPNFWIHGASNFIPNMIKFIKRIHEPKIVKYSEMMNSRSDDFKNIIIKYKSDKNFHNYHVLYSFIIDEPTKKMDILEIGLGTRNPTIPSTMFFYEQDKDFINTPGGSLRCFREYCPNSNIYGADIDREILFSDDRIETFFVDQLDIESLKTLFKNRMFDIIIDDGLHHISSNMNTLLEALDHVKIGGYIVIEDIINTDNWHVIDFTVSRIPGFETKLIDFESGSYIYLVKRISVATENLHDDLM